MRRALVREREGSIVSDARPEREKTDPQRGQTAAKTTSHSPPYSGRTQLLGYHQRTHTQHHVSIRVSLGERRTNEDRTHQIPKPHSRCIRVSPRNLNADSPSKNWESGMTFLADSMFSHPDGIV
jgi:hypothetical protein